MKNHKKIQKFVASSFMLSSVFALGGLGLSTTASAQTSPGLGALILNEWNAVGPNKWLEDGKCDPAFSSCPPTPTTWNPAERAKAKGNGGDWIELVVTQDNLDIRGWHLDWDNDDNVPKSGTITFTSHPLWSSLAAGTIITIRNEAGTTGTPVPANPSYNPVCGEGADWHIEIQALDTRFVTQAGTHAFQTDNDGWRMKIMNGSSTIQTWVGEPGSGCVLCTGGGINSEEVGKLEQDPSSAAANSGANYQDGSCSSYGEPNCWNSGVDTQCFDSLRGCGTCL